MNKSEVRERLAALIEQREQERYAHELAVKEIDLVLAMFRQELASLDAPIRQPRKGN